MDLRMQTLSQQLQDVVDGSHVLGFGVDGDFGSEDCRVTFLVRDHADGSRIPCEIPLQIHGESLIKLKTQYEVVGTVSPLG